jgi:hypothetical protein
MTMMSIFSRVPLKTVVTTSVLAFRSAVSTEGTALVVAFVFSAIPAHPTEKRKIPRNKAGTLEVLNMEFGFITGSVIVSEIALLIVIDTERVHDTK